MHITKAQTKKSVTKHLSILALLSITVGLHGCGGGSDELDAVIDEVIGPEELRNIELDTVDLSENTLFNSQATDCASYRNIYKISSFSVAEEIEFDATFTIDSDISTCSFETRSIPNHSFNEGAPIFTPEVIRQNLELSVIRFPPILDEIRPNPRPESLFPNQRAGVMLNGVTLILLSDGCHLDGSDVLGGCDSATWRINATQAPTFFGLDLNNGRTASNGEYHYTGNPNALFDDAPGPNGSPVIGFAADGYPIFGSYFREGGNGSVRKAISGYSLKTGVRTSSEGEDPAPSGNYDGRYSNDYIFTDSGDLDECNGMVVNGKYGYYVTDDYPYVLACFKGIPDGSFSGGITSVAEVDPEVDANDI